MPKLACFDCDSTLSAIEGIDELARARGPEVYAQVEAMTRGAMDGRTPMESVFARRLEIIRPGRAEAQAVGRRYVEAVEPTAKATVAALVARGWTVVIVSAGFRQAIQPLAAHLGIARVEAVDLVFGPDGAYRGFDAAFPATRTGGKAEVVRRLKAEFSPERTILVGDGVSDLEAKGEVDLFVGFGRYAARDRVRREAGAFVTSLDQVLLLA